jgi:hypothetical protein
LRQLALLCIRLHSLLLKPSPTLTQTQCTFISGCCLFVCSFTIDRQSILPLLESGLQ